jgi:phosphonate transport system substrate-binding protein
MVFKARLLVISIVLQALALSSAMADWRKELGTFRIGMIEAQASQFSPEDMDRLKAAMSGALGIPVEIFRARDFPSLVDAHVSSRIEYALYSSAAYATAWLTCQCVEPVAAPVNSDGSSGYKAVIFARPELKVNDLPQSRGFAIPGRDSLIGFGVPLASLSVSGSALTGKETWLAFAGSQTASITAYRDGKADALISPVPASFKSGTPTGTLPWLESLGSAGGKPAAIWESAQIPFGPHAVRKNLAPEAKDIAMALLAKLPEVDPELSELLLPDNAVAFKPVEHGAYALAVNAARALAAVSGTASP